MQTLILAHTVDRLYWKLIHESFQKIFYFCSNLYTLKILQVSPPTWVIKTEYESVFAKSCLDTKTCQPTQGRKACLEEGEDERDLK